MNHLNEQFHDSLLKTTILTTIMHKLSVCPKCQTQIIEKSQFYIGPYFTTYLD